MTSKMDTSVATGNSGDGNKFFLVLLLLLSVVILVLLLLLAFGVLNICGGKGAGASGDDNPCTADSVSASGAVTHTPVDGPNLACSGSAGLCQTRLCKDGSCVTEKVMNCCGNGICELIENNETASLCPMDCDAGWLTIRDSSVREYTEYTPGDNSCEPNSGSSDGADCDCTETDCDDYADNDNDGLVDCEDPDCGCMECPDCPPCSECATTPTYACSRGVCPDGRKCELVGNSCECTGQQPCEDSLSAQCGGYCPTGEYCSRIVDASGKVISCDCAPTQQQCADSYEYKCTGSCPTGQRCNAVAGAAACICEPVQLACGGTEADMCPNLPCPQGQRCEFVMGLTSAFGSCQCVPVTDECADMNANSCSKGVCAAGKECKLVKNECTCVDVKCENSYAQQCTGACPSGEHCTRTTWQSCVCQPVDCDDSNYPSCTGKCPTGENCRPSASMGGCVCLPEQQESNDCADMSPNECDEGACDNGQVCEPLVTGAGCQCVTPDSKYTCTSMSATSCSRGVCPINEECQYSQGGCECVPVQYSCNEMGVNYCGQGTCPVGYECQPSAIAGSCVCVSLML